MSKTIIVSNRLPLKLSLDGDKITATPSVGGLATGMKSVHTDGDSLWIGWSGLTDDTLTTTQKEKVAEKIRQENCAAVALTQQEVDDFYLGFSNKTLWPLFHYFLEYAKFEKDQWETYQRVNERFAKVILEHTGEDDIIWVHDYQLLLVPQLVKEQRPKSTIGFFLHIPFPSFEIFRTFPWREEVLQGMLGADLLGFHTYDYERHFLSSVKRILRREVSFNKISYDNREIKVDSFPMGIDYDKFYSSAKQHMDKSLEERSELQQRLDSHKEISGDGSKLILSIDRMDYTKGIPNRIRAFEYFLEKYPEYIEKVRLIMLAVPSRSEVSTYKKLKQETDRLVGRINGKFSTVSWTPIWYYYRSMPFDNLIDLYTSADIALITPVRDGMNLVAKEYVATRVNGDGVLILSEMAGASKEMNEALLINPNNFEEFAATIKKAIEMPLEEQQSRIKILQKRLSRYNVERWANEFMKSLKETQQTKDIFVSKKMNAAIKQEMQAAYQNANKRLLLLDYDGTLVGFKNNPKKASPDEELFTLLDQLQAEDKNDVVLISGRDKETFTEWYSHKDYGLITDHGVWFRNFKQEWQQLEKLKTDWMETIRPVIQTFVDRTPGTFIEKKKYSLAWHYRAADPELAEGRKVELKTILSNLIANNNLSILEGNKVLEIKNSSVNKGRASARLLADRDYDFIFAIGDDWTDEYTFEEMPDSAYTVKVGYVKTAAKYYVKDTVDVRDLLQVFIGKNVVS
ncbi:bifunctional alpha,alpha-trehalose-phosphate synthase (UDP-forming)/trehalose-phosphatase [Gangjinia marincola]|uniref:Alpha,alpha-trehalose-phosphate synthase n=1 Tax=Gangjinia marincola TaxID=578463 RepID=A0ABP3XRJ7_9FLAO